MTTLLRKISGSAMGGIYKTHETFKSHSLRGLRNYFVREIGGSFVVIKAVAPKEISDNNNRSRWFGGKRNRLERNEEENPVKSRYL